MSTPKLRWCSVGRALLLGAVAMAAAGGCGRSGTGLGPGVDAGPPAGGSSGGEGGAVGSSGAGGTTDSSSVQGGTTTATASGGQVAASSSSTSSTGGGSSLGGFTTNPGSVTTYGGTGGVVGGMGGYGGLVSWAGGGGWGGTGITGGAKSSGGSTSSASATIVTPREPKLHRPQALSCVGVFAPPEPTGTSGSCKKHADCTQSKGGHCILPIAGYGRAGGMYYCVYDGCAADADCGTDKVCFCSPNDVARCSYSGNCRTDADCGGGASGYCSPSNGYDCSGTYRSYSGHYCHTPKDTCIDDSDCSAKDICDYDPIDGRWECKPVNITCAIG